MYLHQHLKNRNLWTLWGFSTVTLKTEFSAAGPQIGIHLFIDPRATSQLVRTESLKFSCASQASLIPEWTTTAGNGNPTSGRVVSHNRKSGWTSIVSASVVISDFSSQLLPVNCLSVSFSVIISGMFTIFCEEKAFKVTTVYTHYALKRSKLPFIFYLFISFYFCFLFTYVLLPTL